jgi:predicted transcriptional regulator
MLNKNLLDQFYDDLNNELNSINVTMKNEKNEKKSKLLSIQSELINSVIKKLSIIKNNNEKV